MGLFPNNNPSWGYVTGNVLTTRPATAFGTAITPGASNSYGSYTEILSDASVTADCYGMLLNFNSGFVANTARDMIVTIGVDSAGGTSWVDTILHLLASSASEFSIVSSGHWYYFPLFIKSGSAIAAKASVNDGSAGGLSCAIWMWGAPKNLSGLVYGHGVETLGAVTASSRGTAVTPGTTSEGSWTSLGTTTKKWKFAQHGFGVNDATQGGTTYYGADLSFGNGTNQVSIDEGKMIWGQGASERVGTQLKQASYCDVPIGQGIYGRLQSGGTADSNLSMAAYGVY